MDGPRKRTGTAKGKRREGKDPGSDDLKPIGLALPEVLRIRQDGWPDYDMDDQSALRINRISSADENEPARFRFYVNVDNIYLKTEQKAEPEAARLSEERFVTGLTLIGLGIIRQRDASPGGTVPPVAGADSVPDVEDLVKLATDGIGPMILPMIQSLLPWNRVPSRTARASRQTWPSSSRLGRRHHTKEHTHDDHHHPHRNRQHGRHRGGRRQVLGGADAALAGELQDRRRADAALDHPRARHRQARLGDRERGARQARRRGRRRHPLRRPGGDRRRPRRPLPARRLADRLRHPVQHERQRGDLQPRHRAARRRARLQEPDPPQRPRQHVAVLERRLPRRDVDRDRRGGHAPPRARAEAPARGAGRQAGGLRGHREDRPHPPDGRDAADAGAGVLGLRQAGRELDPARGERAAPDLRARPRRHRRRHRPQRAPRVRRARGGGDRGHHRPPVRDRAQQVRVARRARRAGGAVRATEDRGRLADEDRERRAAARLRARAPGSPS